MTLQDALKVSKTVLPTPNPEAITAEGVVRMCYDAVCLNEDGIFRVYGDGILIGESPFSPLDAWDDASINLPNIFLEAFAKHSDQTHNTFYQKEENDQKDTYRGTGTQTQTYGEARYNPSS
jgi:hypothetical protein